jgi:hypothetical protein
MSCSTMQYCDSELLLNINLVYYSQLAYHNEPFQTCADMSWQGFDAGMSLGETGIAFLHSSLHILSALIAGERLWLGARVD